MINLKPLIDNEGEVRELTDEDLAKFKPAGEVLPASLKTKLTMRGRPKVDNPKNTISIRLSDDVLEYFKSTGKGWQTRMNEVLEQYVVSHR
jgi:uncharacterized protein (DUF4415 family)